jgi:hypothetical protein
VRFLESRNLPVAIGDLVSRIQVADQKPPHGRQEAFSALFVCRGAGKQGVLALRVHHLSLYVPGKSNAFDV